MAAHADNGVSAAYDMLNAKIRAESKARRSSQLPLRAVVDNPGNRFNKQSPKVGLATPDDLPVVRTGTDG